MCDADLAAAPLISIFMRFNAKWQITVIMFKITLLNGMRALTAAIFF